MDSDRIVSLSVRMAPGKSSYASIQCLRPKKYRYSSVKLKSCSLKGMITFRLSNAMLTSLLTWPDAFVFSEANTTRISQVLIALTICEA